jgi:GNAT superfamily N-acetyltransferase
VNELERVEAQAVRDVVVLSGGRAELIGGALCLMHPRASGPELNHALPVGANLNVAAIARWFSGHPHVFSVPPGHLGLEESLAEQGYEPGYGWIKFVRDDAPAAATSTDLRVEETLDPDAVAVAVAEGFGMPPEIARELMGFVGAPGWTCFVAWDGAEPAACGALYCHGVDAWFGIGATRPSFRRRGAQGALLAARIEHARAAGARRLTTETGALVDGKPSNSYRNILRAGFTEAYLRPNWRSPT